MPKGSPAEQYALLEEGPHPGSVGFQEQHQRRACIKDSLTSGIQESIVQEPPLRIQESSVQHVLCSFPQKIGVVSDNALQRY